MPTNSFPAHQVLTKIQLNSKKSIKGRINEISNIPPLGVGKVFFLDFFSHPGWGSPSPLKGDGDRRLAAKGAAKYLQLIYLSPNFIFEMFTNICAPRFSKIHLENQNLSRFHLFIS